MKVSFFQVINGGNSAHSSGLSALKYAATRSLSVSEERPENLPGRSLQIWPTVVEKGFLWNMFDLQY